MIIEEAEEKARAAYELGIIKYDQIEAYTQHLLETHKVINKDVGHGTAIPTDSNNHKESPA
jgi:hypothetical protein